MAAALSSKRGIETVFFGATRDFPVTKASFGGVEEMKVNDGSVCPLTCVTEDMHFRGITFLFKVTPGNAEIFEMF